MRGDKHHSSVNGFLYETFQRFMCRLRVCHGRLPWIPLYLHLLVKLMAKMQLFVEMFVSQYMSNGPTHYTQITLNLETYDGPEWRDYSKETLFCNTTCELSFQCYTADLGLLHLRVHVQYVIYILFTFTFNALFSHLSCTRSNFLQ